MVIGLQLLLAQIPAHLRRRFDASRGESALVVIEPGIAPGGLGMAEKGEGEHGAELNDGMENVKGTGDQSCQLRSHCPAGLAGSTRSFTAIAIETATTSGRIRRAPDLIAAWAPSRAPTIWPAAMARPTA